MLSTAVEQVLEEFYGIWRFRWAALGVAWAIAVLGWLVIFSLPDMFEANARVFVDTRSSLKPVLQGLVVEQDVNAQLNYVRQSLLGGPELEKLAKDTGLLSGITLDSRKGAQVIDGLRDRIQITVRSASEGDTNREMGGSVYGINYQDRDRDRALKIVQTLLKSLVDNTLGGKREGAENAQKFLETQIKEIEGRLRQAEDRLAEFKKENVGAMPSEQGGYFARLQTEIDAVKAAQSGLAVTLSRRDELVRQLRGESAMVATVGVPAAGSARGGASNDVNSRILETQARLDDLLLRFTDKHPDVIATRATLAELKERRAAEIESLKRGDAGAAAASGAGSNPVYQSIQLALNQTDVEIASLRRQLADHSARVAELRKALDTMPQVEARYAQLNRDYDVNKTQYTALLTQLEKAKLGQEADTSGTMRFDIIEPPNAEFQPVSPKRNILVLAALVIGLGAGGGLAFLLNKVWPVFWTATSLTAASGVIVLGAVSAAFPVQLRSKTRRGLLAYSAGLCGLVFLAAVALLMGRHGFRIALPGSAA